MSLRISDTSFKFLVAQKGELDHLRHDKTRWAAALHAQMQRALHQIGMEPHHMLDIGSGLGVFDCVMMQGTNAHCTLIDGDSFDGALVKHAIPFGSRAATTEFMNDNGIERKRWSYWTPDELKAAAPRSFPVFDLVVSFRSWCFHYPPEEYLTFVQEHCCPNAIILVDVRKGKREWHERLKACFKEVAVLEDGQKHQRIYYTVRGKAQ